jgi:hypothetical protein
VRELIGGALAAGDWELVSSASSAVHPQEADHAQRLAAS